MNEFIDEDLMFDALEKIDISSQLTSQDLNLSQSFSIAVCYDLIDLDKTPYNFRQEFHDIDAKMYFERMSEICNSNILDLFEKPRDWHFSSSCLKGNLLRELKKLDKDVVKGNPMIFHFALYTSKEGADRKTGVRSPRIYFMLGKYGMIYPLFFDPYHEINPMTNL